MVEIIFTKRYRKLAIKFLKKHREVIPQYKKTILLLKEDPYHPSLRFHHLEGKHAQYQSVSINMKYRIKLDYIVRDGKVILISIGDHDHLYR